MKQVLFGALLPIFGAHVQAGSGSILSSLFFGDEPECGRFAFYCLPHRGRGAMREIEGMVPIAFPHNSTVPPTEFLAPGAPILIEKKQLCPTQVDLLSSGAA